jgi:hypothetical protein
MENKQTAVEWLFEQFENGDMYNVEDAQRIKHQALAMEKLQIVNAFNTADYMHHTKEVDLDKDGHEYYNETYGK